MKKVSDQEIEAYEGMTVGVIMIPFIMGMFVVLSGYLCSGILIAIGSACIGIYLMKRWQKRLRNQGVEFGNVSLEL